MEGRAILRLDDVDVAILRAMGLARTAPPGMAREEFRPAAVARRVGLDPTTVHARLKRLKESGFLRGFELMPNLLLLRREASVHFFDGLDAPTKERAFAKLAEVPGLVDVHDFFKDRACVMLTRETGSETAPALRAVEDALGRAGRELCRIPEPEPGGTLTTLDWRVLRALRADAMRTVDDLAKELDVSARTARRRLERLTAARAFRIYPDVDPREGEGLLVAGILVWPSDPRALRRVTDAIRDRLLVQAPAAGGSVYLVGAFRNAAEVARAEALLAGTHGVERAEANIVQRAYTFTGWIDDAIEALAEGEAPPVLA